VRLLCKGIKTKKKKGVLWAVLCQEWAIMKGSSVSHHTYISPGMKSKACVWYSNTLMWDGEGINRITSNLDVEHIGRNKKLKKISSSDDAIPVCWATFHVLKQSSTHHSSQLPKATLNRTILIIDDFQRATKIEINNINIMWHNDKVTQLIWYM